MAAADPGPDSTTLEPAPDPDSDSDSDSDSLSAAGTPHGPDRDLSDCSICSRRTFLKGAGTLAATAATGALTDVATAQQSTSAGVEVINGAYEVEVTDLPNNTLENKIIRASGAVVHITAAGDDFTIRNVGIQGPVAKGGNAGVIEPQVESPSGSGIISNCYIDDVGDNCVFINASHAGRLDITNTYFGKSVEDSIYGSPPGNGSEFTQRGKMAGEGGTVHIDTCYSEGAVDYAFRVGSQGSSVTNSTVVDAGTALANLYGDGVTFANVDVVRSGIGLKVGDHDEGNMRLLAASGRTTVTALARTVRIDASEPTMENDIAGVNAVLKGQIASNPDSRLPTGVPTSAEAAGRGQSTAAPQRSGRVPSTGGAGGSGVGIDSGNPYEVSAQSNDMIARSRADLDKIQPGMGVWIPPGTTIQFDPSNREGYQPPEGVTFASEGATLEQPAIGFPDTTYQPEKMIRASRGSSFIGLDIKGPIADVGSEPFTDGSFAGRETVTMGIVLEDVGGVEISECDIHGWTAAGVQLLGNSTGTVHHCRIYDQYAADRGYGVATGGASRSRIWYCYFDRCRHCVEAGDSGWYHVKGCSFGTDQVNHICDMHPPAGGGFIIEQSTFHGMKGAARESIMIRQVPNEQSIVRNLWIKHTDKDLAIRQDRTRKCDKPGQTHCGSGPFATSANGYDDFVNMDVSNIHWGASQPPPGVGAPESIPAPEDVPRLGSNSGPVDTGPSPGEIGQIIGAMFTTVLLLVGIVVVVLLLVPLLLLLGALGSAGTE